MIASLAMTMALHFATPSAANQSHCESTPSAETNGYALTFDCGSSGGTDPGAGNASNSYEAYRWELACKNADDNSVGEFAMCNLGELCPEDSGLHHLYGLRNGSWILIDSACRGASDSAPAITPDLVSRAFQRIPLPRLRTIAQPGTKTLVNFDTIFHVEAEPLQREVTLLGQRVELDIAPSSFTWRWGDGTSETTVSPGAPYPSKAVVHRYLDAGVIARATVAVTWTARWRVSGGTWAAVPGAVRTTGPAAALRVVEAVPNLAGPG